MNIMMTLLAILRSDSKTLSIYILVYIAILMSIYQSNCQQSTSVVVNAGRLQSAIKSANTTINNATVQYLYSHL